MQDMKISKNKEWCGHPGQWSSQDITQQLPGVEL
jgi:hypothetical protein